MLFSGVRDKQEKTLTLSITKESQSFIFKWTILPLRRQNASKDSLTLGGTQLLHLVCCQKGQKNGWFFFCCKRFLTPTAILYLYKSQICPSMDRTLSAGSLLFERVQSRLRLGDSLCSSLQPLSHKRNFASLSLLYRYYNG